MEKIPKITAKYDAKFLRAVFSSLDGLNRFALDFYKDAAEIHDRRARVKNVKRNPTRFSLVDAPRGTGHQEA
jgi:23S rRNA G2069 N7-methylase RlmK/C1962 C5-methylase RlmI